MHFEYVLISYFFLQIIHTSIFNYLIFPQKKNNLKIKKKFKNKKTNTILIKNKKKKNKKIKKIKKIIAILLKKKKKILFQHIKKLI